ncbi:MAG: phosphatidylcholine/phosphatidylserine synthase [Treponema sp.]|nr:phosphatidylcholine/phosphatidylserine synthase [Treponema sp.]
MKLRKIKLPKRKARDKEKVAERRKKRLKYIAVIPSLITMMNGAFGFMAIVFASRSPDQRLDIFFAPEHTMTSFALSAYMILLAMVADTLDGRIARLTRTTSSFGGQLDSLSDAISFGVAPAFLMLKLIQSNLVYLGYEDLTPTALISRLVIFAGIFYVMCTIVRLARFNVENDEDIMSHMKFSGLPSPGAAGVVISLVIFHQQFMHGIQDRAIIYLTIIMLPLMTIFAGILMVSRVMYPHLANQLLRSKKTLPSLLLIFALGFFLIWNIQITLAVGFCGFALFGFFRWMFSGLFKKKVVKA